MRHHNTWAALMLCGLLFSPGCFIRSESPPPRDSAEPIVWVEEGIEHAGATIRLGYRGATSQLDGLLEPVATITRDDVPVAGAMVFTSLVNAGSEATTADESATLYEPPGEQSPALYTPGKLPMSVEHPKSAVRFRIVLPDVEEDFVQEVPLLHGGRI